MNLAWPFDIYICEPVQKKLSDLKLFLAIEFAPLYDKRDVEMYKMLPFPSAKLNFTK